jgi:hypothetical protein
MLPEEEWLVEVGVLWRGRKGSPESTIEQHSCEKEKRGERAEFDFGGNDVSAIGDSPLRLNQSNKA